MVQRFHSVPFCSRTSLAPAKKTAFIVGDAPRQHGRPSAVGRRGGRSEVGAVQDVLRHADLPEEVVRHALQGGVGPLMEPETFRASGESIPGAGVERG